MHYYPGGSTAAGMLTDPADIAGIVTTLHSRSASTPAGNAANMPILVTETNSTIDMDTQPAALFGADMYMTWLENGVTNVDWWNEHNGAGTISTVNGVTDYGDQGILSNGFEQQRHDRASGRDAVRALLRHRNADQARRARRRDGDLDLNNALVRVHAVRPADGNLDLLIDNEHPSNSYAVNLAYNGFTPNGWPTVYTSQTTPPRSPARRRARRPR